MNSVLPATNSLALNDEPANEAWHGHTWGFTRHGCRGPLCRAAQAAYMRSYRARLRERKAEQQVAAADGSVVTS